MGSGAWQSFTYLFPFWSRSGGPCAKACPVNRKELKRPGVEVLECGSTPRHNRSGPARGLGVVETGGLNNLTHDVF